MVCFAKDPPKPTSENIAPLVIPDSPRQFLVDRVLRPAGQSLQLIGAGNISLPRRSRSPRTYAPPRQVTFLGGDRVMAEVQSIDGEQIELRLRSGQRAIVRRDTVATISVPAGEQELLYESFEQSSGLVAIEDPAVQRPNVDSITIDRQSAASGLSSLKLTGQAQPTRYTFQEPVPASNIQFWFRVEAPSEPQNQSLAEPSSSQGQPVALRVDFQFETGTGPSQWSVRSTGHQIAVTTGRSGESTARRVVAIKSGWHCLTVTIQSENATISVDDSLLGSTSQSPGRLQSLQFSSELQAWIDDLQIRQQAATTTINPIRASSDDDCVILHSGDQLYGQVKQINAAAITMSSPRADISIPWNKVVSVAFRQAEHIVAGSIPRVAANAPAANAATSAGPARRWATVEFQSSFNLPQQPSDRLRVAMIRLDRDFFIASHPFLGEIAIGWNQLVRIEPHFFGQQLTLDARTLHLGDSIREDFQRATPDGVAWFGDFDLVGPLSADAEVWLTMDVVDLEPSGPGTPPASPFLKELRSGRLLTQVKLNQELAGDLNRWIHFRASPRHAERVRCRLPATMLKEGRNYIGLDQVPRKDSKTGFDNCEISNLRLEIIQRAP